MSDISTLQQSLINAKKVMNKVDGTTSTNNSVPSRMPSQHINESELLPSLPPSRTIPTGEKKPNLNPKAAITEDKINNSNLPEAIKQAMIETPIPDIPFNGGGAGLSEDFLSGVKEQMEKQGLSDGETMVTRQEVPQQQIKERKSSKKLTSSNLKTLIRESVKDLLEEVVNERINDSIGLRTESNENFQFRVGDNVFYGKITSTKKVK